MSIQHMVPLMMKREDQGFTLVELLVALGISSILLTLIVSSFAHYIKVSNDMEQKMIAELQAQNVIDVMVPEFRMIGNGVPFHQANFLIAQAGLSDNTVTEPILASGTTASQIRFRLNESGETYIVTAAFNPASTSTVSLTSVAKMAVGDNVYITNSTVGDDDGFWGSIQSIDTGAKTITFAADMQYIAGTTFAQGSLLEVVPIVTYTSTSGYGGITRDSGNGPLSLVTTGQFALEYIDADSASMTLPLVASAADPFPASAIQNVRSIKISVSVRSPNLLSTGQYYIATVTQSVGIRNLNYKY